ncbi:site-specific integrase [Hyphococcus sp.]|uniref:site-specific integrase n=1 Tax=Hyphococcus sp. TaxID=2038636 RepID=UPI0035C6CCD2
MKKPKYVVVDYDRHGNARIYYREPGKRKIRLRGPLYEEDFWKDYQAAKEGKLKPKEAPKYRGALPAFGTFDRLCVDYYQSPEFRALNPDTRYRRRLTLDPIREVVGELPARRLKPQHIRAMRDKRAEKPHAANGLLKALRQLFSFAVEYGFMDNNPARDVKLLKIRSKGYHTWTLAEIEKFQKEFPLGTQPRLALDLMLYTGARRDDAYTLGPQHVRNGRLVFTPKKTADTKGTRVSIPLHPRLVESINATPTGDMTFLTKKNGRPWGSRESFGNRFKDWCAEAGLSHCSAHGLRKAASVMLVDAGCSSAQATAITGHDSLQVFEGYVRARDREKLADDAMELWTGGEKSVEIVPPASVVLEDGTKINANLLIGKGSVCGMAPLREHVSNFVSGSKGGISSAITGNRTLVGIRIQINQPVTLFSLLLAKPEVRLKSTDLGNRCVIIEREPQFSDGVRIPPQIVCPFVSLEEVR